MMIRKALGFIVVLSSSLAYAGGFEFPDNGTEALGRGGAFTAKADSALALQYNVAGLARQRGTRLLFDNNLSFHNYRFLRAGTYPGDPTDPATPFAGQPFPEVSNTHGVFYAPFFGVSTDFRKLERWTFAIGAFGPSAIGKRGFGTLTRSATYPQVGYPLQNGMPSPGRYDLTDENLFIVYPTIAAAVRVTKWLDLGLALHLVVSKFELSNVAFVDLGRGFCPYIETPQCDSPSKISTTGVTAMVALGAMFRPLPQLAIGLNLRPRAARNTPDSAHRRPDQGDVPSR